MNANEKRSSPRYIYVSDITIQLGDGFKLDCRSMNLSEGGMGLTTSVLLKVGTVGIVSFVIDSGEERFTFTSEFKVMWSRQTTENPPQHHSGIRFTRWDAESARRLWQLINCVAVSSQSDG